MRMPGWRLLVAALVSIGSPPGDAWAQTYPAKAIHIFVGFAAGGATDAIARQVAQKLSETLGQPVIVDNYPGASTAIATERQGFEARTGTPEAFAALFAGRSSRRGGSPS